MPLSSRGAGALLVLGALVVTLILVNLVANPGPLVIDTTEGAAHVVFSAERRLVEKLGDCVTVRWETENIRTIRYNEEPTIGVGSSSACIDGKTPPSLRIEFPDGVTREYRLGIGVAFAEPLVWLLALAALMLFFTGSYLLAAGVVARGALTGAHLVRRVGKAAALFAFGLAMTLLLLEIGLRVYFTSFGSEQDRVQYLYSADEIQTKTGRFIGLPYVGYGPSPYFPEHNQFGYRGPEVVIPKPDGVFRIVALGASTTYGFGVEPDETYPAQLQAALRDDYGYENVEVVNGGVMGYTSWETLGNLAFRALELQPDLVIFYEATNDVEVRATSPACYHAISPLRGLNTFHGLWKTHANPISPSALYRFVAINLGWMPNPAALEFAFADTVVKKDCAETTPVSPEEAIAQNPPVYYERNLRNLIAVAQANGIEVMVSRFIYATPDLASFALPDYWRAAIEEHNAIAERVAGEMGAHYYDLKADFHSAADDWWSGVHMTAKGARQQASLYAAFLVDEALISR